MCRGTRQLHIRLSFNVIRGQFESRGGQESEMAWLTGQLSSMCFALRPKYLRNIFGFLLRQTRLREQAERHITGAVGQLRVPKEYLSSYLVPLTPEHEQVRIANKLHNVFDHIGRMRRELAYVHALSTARGDQTRLIKNFDRAVLDRAFSGMLHAQDPTDEPALELIQKIQADRAGRTEPKRGRRKVSTAR